jgi:hypothetical protein
MILACGRRWRHPTVRGSDIASAVSINRHRRRPGGQGQARRWARKNLILLGIAKHGEKAVRNDLWREAISEDSANNVLRMCTPGWSNVGPNGYRLYFLLTMTATGGQGLAEQERDWPGPWPPALLDSQNNKNLQKYHRRAGLFGCILA